MGLLPAGDSSYLFWYQLLGQMREKGIVELVGELTSLTCRGYMQVSGAIGLQVAVPQPRVPCDQAPSWLASPTSLAMAPALQALWVAHQNSAWAPTVAVSPPWAHTSVSGAKIEMPAGAEEVGSEVAPPLALPGQGELIRGKCRGGLGRQWATGG